MANERFGPNNDSIEAFAREVPAGFCFRSLGEPSSRDAEVLRVRSWEEFDKLIDYDKEDAHSENSQYLKFLSHVRKANKINSNIVKDQGWSAIETAAIEWIGDVFVDDREDWSDEVGNFMHRPEYDEPYPYLRFSIQDHCAYITRELVVAHLTDVHLLRDMWSWYKAGHWPCGWEGDWPQGRLIVF